MLAVQNYQMSPKVAFKANEDTKAPQAPNNTHAGLKTGAVYSAVGSAMALGSQSVLSSVEKAIKQSPEATEELGKGLMNEFTQSTKALKTANKFYLPIFILTALGCGAIVDKAINKKRAALQQRLETEDKKAILESDDNVDTTAKGNLFYKSSEGKKLGTVLGAVAMPALGIISNVLSKTKVSVGGALCNILVGAIGGVTLGAITDACANKKAKVAADKQ